MKLNYVLTTALILLSTLYATAQEEFKEEVIVNLTEKSTLTFTIRDRDDLDLLRDYDFQALFDDMLEKIRERTGEPQVEERDSLQEEEQEQRSTEERLTLEPAEGNFQSRFREPKIIVTNEKRTQQSFTIDFGINNYLSNGKFPSEDDALYSVRPLGSWYVAGFTTQRTRIANKFFADWSLGVSWYNFKFVRDNVQAIKDTQGIDFYEDTRDFNFRKSKLTASYLTVSLVPVLDFGNHEHPSQTTSSHSKEFRIGAGMYAGYLLGGHSKLVYKDGGNREREKNRENLYLNNLRYGARIQIGVGSVDCFLNYDLSDLFNEGRGPELNAFSFGIIL